MNKSYVLFSVFPILLLSVWQNQNEEVIKEDSQQEVAQVIEAPEPKPEEANYLEITEYLQDAQRSRRELNEEWATWVGDASPTTWEELNFKKPQRLSMILTEIQNNADSPFHMIHIHSIGFAGQQDDTVTYFNRLVDGIEEKNIHADIVVPQSIEQAETGFQLSKQQQKSYRLALDEQNFKRVFDERSPQVVYDFQTPHQLDFDVIGAALAGSGLSESGLYEQELSWQGKNYEVQMNLRQTNMETTTVEVQLQEVGSLTTQKFALIYEAI